MGQSLVQNYIHIAFSTKYREALIYVPYEQDLHAYMARICQDYECPALIVGGYVDHIHILCRLSQKIPLMTLVQKVTSYSSKRMTTNDESLAHFFWQNGYGAFSVNRHQVDVVMNCIKNQHAHHRRTDFKEEYRGLLEKYEVE
ncbi:MAG: IS200/IS605 family transposase [Aureispira sp.]